MSLERLGNERRLIFENVANGVPMPQIMAAFCRSEAEILREVEFVGRKIGEFLYKAMRPPLACGTMQEIRWNRLALLDALAGLGPVYLGTQLTIPRIYHENLNHPGTVKEAANRIGAQFS